MPRIGEIGLLRNFISVGIGVPPEGLLQSTIVEVMANPDGNNRIIIQRLLPYSDLHVLIPAEHFDLINYTRQQILGGAVEITNTTNLRLELRINKNYKEKSNKDSDNTSFTYEQLSKLFKYIPIYGSKGYGFYNEKLSKGVISEGVYNHKTGEVDSFKYKFIDIPKEAVNSYFSTQALISYCKFKITSADKSGKLFRSTKAKRSMIGQTLQAAKLDLQVSIKQSESPEDVIYLVYLDGSKQRWCLSDVEIIYPATGITNINGLYPKKDRTIKVGSVVVPYGRQSKLEQTNGKHVLASKGEQMVVMDIKTTNSFKLHGEKIVNKSYLGFDINGKIVYKKINEFKLIK